MKEDTIQLCHNKERTQVTINNYTIKLNTVEETSKKKILETYNQDQTTDSSL